MSHKEGQVKELVNQKNQKEKQRREKLRHSKTYQDHRQAEKRQASSSDKLRMIHIRMENCSQQ